MKPSEFYEQYWRVDYGDGKLVSPPKLSQAEKDFLDSAVAIENTKGVLFTRKRKRQVQVDVEVLKSQMKYLPKYFIPANQPTLDKYGNILSEQKKLPPNSNTPPMTIQNDKKGDNKQD